MFVPCDAADDVIDRGKRHVERYDDPKVAAAAEPPEQLRIFFGSCAQELTVSEDDLSANNGICRSPILRTSHPFPPPTI